MPSTTLLSRALALHQAGELAQAKALYQELLSHDARHVHAASLLGSVLMQQGKWEEGIAWQRKALAIQPDYWEAQYNLAVALMQTGQYNEALEAFDRAILLDPAEPEAQWNKGLLSLLLGDFAQGWKLYEWRWKRAGYPARRFCQPLWLGRESLKGKTIFLYPEQGLGDVIQFCRYVPMVEALGARVIMEMPAPLMGLISTLPGSFELVQQGAKLPAFDVHCPLLSLPLAFGTRLDTIPARIPYLSATNQKRLGPRTAPRIGLVWSGAATHLNDHNRSIPFSLLAPLLHTGCEFHSLQKEVRPQDAALLEQSRVLTHDFKDFTDTAALISELDLVISVDTSVAHLAGALGKPVWVLLPFVPDFRWLTEREDSPWYPTMRLFRQPRSGDWESVIGRVSSALQETPIVSAA